MFITILLGVWVCLIWLPSSSHKVIAEDQVPVTCVVLLSFCWHQRNDSQFISTWNKLVSAQKLCIVTVITKHMTNWQLRKWILYVSNEKKKIKHSIKIIALKYLISYEKSEIQITSLIGLPWIFQHVCTLLTCPIFHPMVSIKSWKLTAWVRSLSSASGSCQNWICHTRPFSKQSISICQISSCDGAKRSLSTHLTPVAWHLPSIQTQFMASAYGI